MAIHTEFPDFPATDLVLAFVIADRFAAILKKWLTAAEFAEMKRRNEQDAAYVSGACASHDYCDANVALDEAFIAVVGRPMEFDSDADVDLWNMAWEDARKRHIGAAKEPRR